VDIKLNQHVSFSGSGLTGAGYEPGFSLWHKTLEFYPIHTESDLDVYLAAVKAAIMSGTGRGV
jgi:hypothetical protein